jgi:hypothetical protein
MAKIANCVIQVLVHAEKIWNSSFENFTYMSDFDVKNVNFVIFSHVNICFEKKGLRNER